jgi:AbrB family looped-hinge helix DNA binding protein
MCPELSDPRDSDANTRLIRHPRLEGHKMWVQAYGLSTGCSAQQLVEAEIIVHVPITPSRLRRPSPLFDGGRGPAAGYTDGMTSKVGPKGQVVIPKAMRDRLGLRPGDAVTFELEGRAVKVGPATSEVPLRGRLREHDLVGMLEADRRAEPR